MGSCTRYSDEFKQEAVNQVTIHGYAVSDVANRLGITSKSLYNWTARYGKPKKKRKQEGDLLADRVKLYEVEKYLENLDFIRIVANAATIT